MWWVLSAITASAGPSTSRAVVSYPAAASGSPSCEAHVLVNGEGKSDAVLVAPDCPRPFADEMRAALTQWRWEPDGTTFVEARMAVFSQNAPSARVGPATVLEAPVDTLLVERHHSAVPPKERIAPKFPTAAVGESGKCRTDVVFPVTGGHPLWVGVSDCPEVFHKAARLALLDWDFEAVTDAGEARWVRTKIALVFEEPEDAAPLTPVEAADRVERIEHVPPTFPAGGRKHSPAVCIAEFTIPADGRPRDVVVSGCDPVFHVATENAVQRWLYRHEGEPRELRVAERIELLSKRDQRRRARGD